MSYKIINHPKEQQSCPKNSGSSAHLNRLTYPNVPWLSYLLHLPAFALLDHRYLPVQMSISHILRQFHLMLS